MPREHHRRRSSRDSSRRRNRRRSREFYYSNPAAPTASRAADSVYATSHPRLDRRGSRSSLSSSSSSSYMEISRNTPPRRSGNVFTTFFTAPSEHRRRNRRRARTRVLPFGNSSSSSLDSDLAYGTGFIRRPRDSRHDTRPGQPQQYYRDDYRQNAPQYQWGEHQQAQYDPRYAQATAPQGYAQAQPYSQQPHDPRYQPSHDPAYSQYYPPPFAEPREARTHAESSTVTPTSFAGPAVGAGLGLAAASALAGREIRDDRAGRDRDRDRDHRDGRGRRLPRSDRDDQHTSSAAETNATPRPTRLQRRSTDEEIMHIGQELTRLHSDIDSRPTGLVAGGSKKSRDRGIGSSRPYEGPYSSDDEGGEWESVDSESSKEDFLAYGSTVSFPEAPSRPAEQPATAEAPPLGFTRGSTFVDPRNFGPQNSLNGFVSPLPSAHPRSSAPMQQVDAAPMDDGRGPLPPSTQVYPKLSRPTDVQLEQPTPVAPVSPERLERSSHYHKPERKVSGGKDRKTSSGGKILTGAALATAAGVVGHTILSDDKVKDKKRARAEDESRHDDHRDSTKRDRRAAEERERRDKEEEEERRKRQIDAEYEEYLESMRRRPSGDRSRRTKHDDSGLPRESRRGEPGKPKESREPRESRDQRRLPSSQPKSTGDYFDYRRFQVPDDAFPTPTYSRHATPDRAKEVVSEAPRIFTVDREPSFSPPRLSRKDSFEMEQMAEEARRSPRDRDRFEEEEAELKRAYEEARRRANAGDSPDIIPASYADEDPWRGRRSSKDPVLEEADEFYRKSRRSAAEEIRSRSTSPSVVGKWQDDDKEGSEAFIVPSPDPEHHKPRSPFSGPNANVRVDSIFDHPKQLTRFLEHRARSASEGQLLLGTRDPSADRERPLLNIVRPTPVPSPSIERRREREKARAARSRWRSKSQTRSGEVDVDSSETGPVREVSPANVVIGPRGEVIDLTDEQPSARKADIPPRVADRSLEEFETPDELARRVWGTVNTDLASKFDPTSDKGPVADEGAADEGSRAVDAREIDLVDEEPAISAREFDSRHSDSLPERDAPAHRDTDVPALPRSRSASRPSSPKIPGSFGDDLEFAATIGAGLKAAGFDDSIAADDPQYRRRDSPPGSHDELGTVSRDAPSAVPEGDEWGTSVKGKKKKKKAKKQRQASEPEVEPTRFPEEERPSQPIEIVEPVAVEARRRSVSPEHARDRSRRRSASSERARDRSRRRSASPERTRDRSRRRSASPEWTRSKSKQRSVSPEMIRDRSRRRSLSPEHTRDEFRRRSRSPEHARDEFRRRSASPERTRDAPAERGEPAEIPAPVVEESQLPPKKLSKKERKLLAKRAAESQLQEEQQASAVPSDEPAAREVIDESRVPKEGSRELPVTQFEEGNGGLPSEDPSERGAMPEAGPGGEDASRPSDDVPPPDEDLSLKKLSKKERKLLAKRKAAEAQAQDEGPTPAVPSDGVDREDREATDKPSAPLDEGSRELSVDDDSRSLAVDEGSRSALPSDELSERAVLPEDSSLPREDAPSLGDIPPPEDRIPSKKLSKKERKLLAKQKAAETQLQDEQGPAAPSDDVIQESTEQTPSAPEESSRELSMEGPSDPVAPLEDSRLPGNEGARKESVSLPEEDPPRKLTKKEQRKLAKKKAAEAQLQDEQAPPSDDVVRESIEQPPASFEEGSREQPGEVSEPVSRDVLTQDDPSLPVGDISHREDGSLEQVIPPPEEDASQSRDDVPLPEDGSAPRKLTKKEQRKLAKKQKASQLDEVPAPEPPMDDSAGLPGIEPAPGKAEDAWEIGGSPPAEGVSSPTADDDVWHEAVEEAPPGDEETPRDAPALPDDETPKEISAGPEGESTQRESPTMPEDESTPKDTPAVQEESFAVPSKKKKKKKKGAAALDTASDKPTDELPRDDLPRDDLPRDDKPTDDLPKDDLPKDDLPKDDLPKDDLPKDDLPTDDLPTDGLPKDDPQSGDLPKGDLQRDDLPRDDLRGDDLPKDELPTADLPKDELPGDELTRDTSAGDELPRDELRTDDLSKDDLPKEGAPQEEAIWATPTKKGKKGKKNRRKLDDSANPEPPDKGHANGHHANGHDQAKSDSIGQDSFLARAGTPGEGVGVPGAAAAVVAASAALTGSHATDSPSEKKETPSDSDRGVGPGLGETPVPDEGSQAVDPDVVPRQVKYVIDPQHGDLLSLPPSTPPSPSGSVDENLPQLPDSRPDTPPEEAYKRELLKSRRRKSTQDSPHARSTSETSIPLPLLLGQRSNPSSPRYVRPSPTGSPASPAADRKSFSRPISWDSKKDIRPLILPTRQGNESPSRSVSPLKDPQQRELGEPPAIGLGLSDPKSHVDPDSSGPVDQDPCPDGSADRDTPAEEPGIDLSTPTRKKKGKGKATADDLARPDSDSAPDDTQIQSRVPAWEDGFDVPEVSKGESVDPIPVDPVESGEPVSKKDKRKKKKKKQSLDSSRRDSQELGEPISEAPPATAETEKSTESAPVLEPEVTESQPVVEGERSLGPQPDTVQEEPSIELELAESQPMIETERSLGPQLDTVQEEPAMQPEVVESQPVVEAERSLEPQLDTVPEEPVMTKAERKKAKKKKKASQSSWDDVPTGESGQPADEKLVEQPPIENPPDPEKPADELPADERLADERSADEKPVEQQPIETPREPSSERVADPVTDVSGTDTPGGGELERSIIQPSQDDPAPTTKGKKSKKKKKASQSLGGDVSSYGPEPSEQSIEEKQIDLPVDSSGIDVPGDPVPSPPSGGEETLSVSEEKVTGSQGEGETSEAPQPEQQSAVQSQPVMLVSEPTDGKDPVPEEGLSRETPRDDVALPVSGKKAKKKKKKGSTSEGPEPSTLAVSQEESSTSLETTPEDHAFVDLNKGDDEKESGALDPSESSRPPDEPESSTRAVSQEQSSESLEASEVPKEVAPEDLTSTDLKKSDDEMGLEALDRSRSPPPLAELETELKDVATEGPALEDPQPVLSSPDDQPGPAVPETSEAKGAGHEKDDQSRITTPEVPASDDVALERDRQTDASAQDPLTAPAGKKGKKAKKGKKKRGSVDESTTPAVSSATDEAMEPKLADSLTTTGESVSQPTEELSESPEKPLDSPGQLPDSPGQLLVSAGQRSGSPEQLSESPEQSTETVPDHPKDEESGDVQTEQSAEGPQALERSGPDTTTGAEESSSTVLEPALSGKKSKKKKKKSVSFADLPPDPTASSTVSPMPEMEDDVADVPLETGRENDPELVHSLGETRDDGRDSAAPESPQLSPELSELSSEIHPTSDISLSPKSKKKKKKGKAVEDLVFNSDADVSAPPTPIEESREFPAGDESASEKAKSTEVELPPDGMSEAVPVPQEVTPESGDLGSQPGADPVLTDATPTDDVPSTPLTKKDKKKKKKKKGASTPEPELEPSSEPVSAVESEQSIPADISPTPITQSVSPIDPEPLPEVAPVEPSSTENPPVSLEPEPERLPESQPAEIVEPAPPAPETDLQADILGESSSSAPLSKKDRKKKKKKGKTASESEPVSGPVEQTQASPATEERELGPGSMEQLPGDSAVSEEREPGPGFVEQVPGDSAVTGEQGLEPGSVKQGPGDLTISKERELESGSVEQAPGDSAVSEEREPGPGSVEQVPDDSAVTEERELESGSVEQAPGETAVTEESTPVREVAESQEIQDDSLSSGPRMSKKDKKKRKKAKTALQQDPSTDVESQPAPTTPGDGERIGEETQPVVPEAEESPDTQVVQEPGTVPDAGPESPPPAESSMDADQSSPDPSELRSQTEIPAPDSALILQERPVSPETPAQESTPPEEPTVQGGLSSPGPAQESTVAEDKSSQAPLSKKDRKKKKKAKAKSGAALEGSSQVDSEPTPTATPSDDIPKANPTPASQEPAEPVVPAETTSVEEPLKSAEVVERVPESGEPAGLGAIPDDASPTRDTSVKDESSAFKDDNEKERGIEDSSLSTSAPEHGSEWDAPTKTKKKKGKKSVSRETLAPDTEDGGTEQRAVEGSLAQSLTERRTDMSPSLETPDRELTMTGEVLETQSPVVSQVDDEINKRTSTPHSEPEPEARDLPLAGDDERQTASSAGNEILTSPVTDGPTRDTSDRDLSTTGEIVETQVPVVGDEDLAGPSSQVDDGIIKESTMAVPSDELGSGIEPSPPLTGQLPEGSGAPEPSGSAQEQPSIEDVVVPSTSKKEKKKKKKGKKSMTSAELEAGEAVAGSVAQDNTTLENPSTPGVEPTDQLGDTSRSGPEERLPEPEPEVAPGMEKQSADKQESVPEIPAPASIQSGEQDDWASPSTKGKGKKGKKKRGKAPSEATTPAPSRPASPVLGQSAVSSDEQRGDIVLDEPQGDIVLDEQRGDVGLDHQPGDGGLDRQRDDSLDDPPGDDGLDRQRGDSISDDQRKDEGLVSQRGEEALNDQRGEDGLDKQPGDLVTAESSGEGAPEAVLGGASGSPGQLRRGSSGEGAPDSGLDRSSPIQTPGEGDHLLHGDSGVGDASPVREEQEIRQEPSPTPTETAPEAVSAESPVEPSQRVLESTRDEKPAVVDDRADSLSSTKSKKKKGKKGKKKDSGTSETTTPAASRPPSPSPATVDPEPTPATSRPPSPTTGDPEQPIGAVEGPEPSGEPIPLEAGTIETGATGSTGDDRDVSIPKSGNDEAHDDTPLAEVPQPLSPVREASPPRPVVENSDSWDIPTNKKKKGKKGKGKADAPAEGAGLGLFRPASPARDDTLQPFRTGDQGETGVRTGDLPVETGSRADTPETREFPAASDDRRAGGAEGQDATEGQNSGISQPLPAADKETPPNLHDPLGPEPVPAAAEFEPTGEGGLSGRDNTDWDSPSTKKKGRKGKGKAKHLHDVPGAPIPPSTAADEDTRLPAESINPDTPVSDKPDIPVSVEPGLEPIPEEERHEPDSHIPLESIADPDGQSEVQREIPSTISPQVKSDIRQPEIQQEIQPGAGEEATEEPDATITPQPESTDLAAEPSAPGGPSEPETEPVVGHETHVPTEDPPGGGLNVSKKKGKKGKKKGQSTSATPVVSRPLSPVGEDPPESLSEPRDLSALDPPPAETEGETTKDEPVASEQGLGDWDLTPKKKKGKKGKKRDGSSHTNTTISRPMSPVTDKPSRDPEPTPDEAANTPAVSRPTSPVTHERLGDQETGPAEIVPVGEVEGRDFTAEKEKERDPSLSIATSTSRPASPVIDELGRGQEAMGEQGGPAQGDPEPEIPAREEVEDWGFTTKKKGKKSKKRAALASGTTTPTASRAISPTRATSPSRADSPTRDISPSRDSPSRSISPTRATSQSRAISPPRDISPARADSLTGDISPTRADSRSRDVSPARDNSPTRATTETLPAPTEPQQAGDDWGLSRKKKGKKKGKKAKIEHEAPEQPVDRAERLSLPEERAPGSPIPEPEIHLTPAQRTSHITHDSPSGEVARPEKRVKTGGVDSLTLSEPAIPVQEPLGEASTIEQPATGFEEARDVGNDGVPIDSEERQQVPQLDKGKGVDISSTHDVDDTRLGTSLDDETKGPTATEAAAAAGVVALADKFGGQISKSKKKGKKKKVVDKRTEQEEDLFDDPMLWESPDKKTLTHEEGVVGEEEFWGGGDRKKGSGERSLGVTEPTKAIDEESLEVAGDKHAKPVEVERGVEDVTTPTVVKTSPDEPATRSGLEEVTPVVVEEPAMDVERATPEVEREPIEEDLADEERQSREVEGRRSLGSEREVETRMKDRQASPVSSNRDLPMADVTEHSRSTQSTRGVTRLERTWDEPGESPILGRGEMQEDRAIAEETRPIPPVTPTRDLAPAFDDSPYTPLRRSMSRNLEPVPEEEPEMFGSPTQSKERRSRKLPASTDMNRDSGFATNSPRLGQRSQWQQEGPHRDSGVHLKDWAESPRHVSPEPSSSRQKDAFKTPEPSERRLKRSPRSAKDLREHEHPMSRTPVFREPSPHAPTPEPQKSVRDYKTPETPRSRYHDLETPSLSAKRPSASKLAHGAPLPRSNTNSPAPGQRSVSDNTSRPRHTPSPDVAPRRVASNTSLTRQRTPDPKLRPDTPGSIRSLHSATPPLRRAGRRISGDLRSISLSQRGQAEAPPSADSSDEQRSAQNSTPVANEGRVRSKDMTDVYDGFGEGRIGSPRSPTRPHSMRRRQSMQVIELESQVNDLLAQNLLLQQERQQYGDQSHTKKTQSLLADRDAEIDVLKRSIEQLNREVSRLVEVNEGLNAANTQLSHDQSTRYRDLELLHAEASRELETTRTTQGAFEQQLQDKDAEIADLREQLETAKAQIQEMQEKILETSRPADADFLDLRDVDYFDRRCQQLCQHAQQWVLRFSKFSDMRSCRLTSEINDEKIIDRLDNTILDGSDVDKYLRDRVRRRDIFMSMTMNMIWEFVFTRYLFGMDREQRQKLKSLEKHLTEVGPPNAVRQWRAVTLTLLSRRPSFQRQRELDSEAVVQAILGTLSLILPPPTHLEDQIQATLRRVMNEAVDLAVAMRTQRAEYMMLPPLEPKYDADGELAETVTFNASLMSERSGDRSLDPAELQAQSATVRIVLFPLVVRRGDESGVGDDEVVVCPAQVLIARSRRKSRGVTPSDLGGAPVGGSAQDLAPSEFLGTEMSRLE